MLKSFSICAAQAARLAARTALLCPLWWAAIWPQAHAQTAAPAPAPAAELRPQVRQHLLAAQTALQAQQAQTALSQAALALALPALNDSERQWLWRVQATAAMRLQDWPLAVQSLDALLALPGLSGGDRLAFQESLVHAAVQLKDWPRAARVAQAYVQANGPLPAMRTAWLQGLSMQGQHAQLAQEMRQLLARDAAQNHVTPEAELRMLGMSQRQLKDDAGYSATLLRLLQLHPSPAYWADAVPRLLNHPAAQPRHELEVYRLLQASGNLTEAGEFAEMATLAIKAGLPSMALSVIAQAEKAGVWGKGADAAAHQRLQAQAQAKAKEDDAALPPLMASARRAAEWAAVGQALDARQQWAQAVSAFERAQQAGDARRPDELRLHHGISLFHAGQKSAARAQWAAIETPGMAAELARFWALLARD